jgi:putative phosphoesterase
MKLAIISDVHGNLPALEAVINDIDLNNCEQIISLGDVAGYYCYINECIELLKERNVINILGNHDYYIVEGQNCPRSHSANLCLDFQRGKITQGSIDWLNKSILTYKTSEISMVHGGWNDPLDEYLYNVDYNYFVDKSEKYFFSGHTHIQIFKEFSNKFYCNPGSVGQPRDNNPKAAYCIYNDGTLILKRVDYDIDKVAFGMKKAGFENFYYENLYFGRRISKL